MFTRCCVALGVGGLLLGCRPLQYQTYAETDVVATISDGRDFSTYSTFALSQTVIDLDLCEDPREVDHERIDPIVLQGITTNLEELGWTQVDLTTGDPDTIVVGGIVACDNWYWVSYPGWWDWWWYYPPTTVPVNYPVGSVILTMFDPNDLTVDIDGSTKVPVVWAAGITGQISGSGGNATRLADDIDQAFEQSAYLEVSP